MTTTPGSTPHPHYTASPLPEKADTLIARCTCAMFGLDDLAEEVGRVAALTATGVPMREACLLVWADGREAFRANLRQSFRTRWPDIQLPDWSTT